MTLLYIICITLLMVTACDRTPTRKHRISSHRLTASHTDTTTVHFANTNRLRYSTTTIPPATTSRHEHTRDPVSNALLFARAIDLDTPFEDGNVEYMTCDNAQRLLDKQSSFTIDFLENVILKCRNFEATKFLITNLFYKLLEGDVTLTFDTENRINESLDTIPYTNMIVDYETALTKSATTAAAHLLYELSLAAMSENEYDDVIQLTDLILTTTEYEGQLKSAYSIRAHTYESMRNFEKAAEEYEQWFPYAYNDYKHYKHHTHFARSLKCYFISLINAGHDTTPKEIIALLKREGKADAVVNAIEK